MALAERKLAESAGTSKRKMGLEKAQSVGIGRATSRHFLIAPADREARNAALS
jgi:hypothetical protein